MKDEQYSDEQLNAFVDGELDSKERTQLLDESAKSKDLDERLCKRRKLKELVSVGYQQVPKPNRTYHVDNSWKLGTRALVASVLILFGLGSGVVLQKFYMQQQSRALNAIVDASIEQAVDNYILHVTSGTPEAMQVVLQKAQRLINESKAANKKVQVEIIANEKGLNLLRSDVTPFAEQITALSGHNIAFYACSRAIERLEEKGVKVMLVPEAVSNSTALDRVVSRMQEGWNYIKI